jgi:hypothetical protein
MSTISASLSSSKRSIVDIEMPVFFDPARAHFQSCGRRGDDRPYHDDLLQPVDR